MPILDLLQRLYADAEHVLDGAFGAFGYLIIFLASFVENTALLSLIFPGGTVVTLGGVQAGKGQLSFIAIIIVGALGTTLGSSVDFLLGRLSRRGSLGLVSRSERVVTLLRKAEHFYDVHGPRVILGAHFVGWARAVASLGAGACGMPYRQFIRYEIAAALMWNTLYSGLGYVVGLGGLSLAVVPVITITIGVVLGAVFSYVIRPNQNDDSPRSTPPHAQSTAVPVRVPSSDS